jgi:hypothetical protein
VYLGFLIQFELVFTLVEEDLILFVVEGDGVFKVLLGLFKIVYLR